MIDRLRAGCAVFSLMTLVVATAPSAEVPTEMASSEPFGVVCPWPGIQKAGIRWCRVGAGATAVANWVDIEKSPNVYDWTAADNELRWLADSPGLSPLPIFGYTPRWASRAPEDADPERYPPKDLTHFSRFVRQCVARYKDRVKVWEVWNEPNIGFFHGSAAEYARMVKAAAVAAKQEDPDCRIAMGCAGVDCDFLQRLYEFGCGPYFDVMSVHPYQWGRQFNHGWMVQKLQACRDLMDRHGDKDKEIWITEFGWSVAEGVTPQEQANLLAQAVLTALSVRQRLKVEKVFWYCVKDWGGPGFGLLDVDGKAKPALHAYEAVIAELAKARYCGPWKGPDGVCAHLFERSGQPLLTLWTPSPDHAVQVEVRTSAASLHLRTVANQQTELTPKDGKAVIEVTHAPVFLSGWAATDFELTPPPQATTARVQQTKPMGGVWISIVPPPTTARPYLVFDGDNELPIEIHNDGCNPARGELQVQLAHDNKVLTTGQLAFDVAPGTSQTVTWRPTLPRNEALAGTLADLHVRGSVGQELLVGMDLPVRLLCGKAIEFAANSWVELPYLHKAEHSGCADSVRFGNDFGYRFELHDAESARLRINVGANGAEAWSVLVSNDDKQYTTECSGKSWPSWQTVDLDKYLAAPHQGPPTVYVKIQGNGCQVLEVVLETKAQRGREPAK